MSSSRYSSEELRNINTRNTNRLPPATAVHGMALYELQRHGEQERLFHAAMFDVSQLRQTSTAQQSKIDSLERAVNYCTSHHDNERSASLAGVRALQDGLNSFTTSDNDPKAVLKRSTWLVNELDQEDISTEDQVALTTILTTNHIHEAKMELHQAIQLLKDDHLTVTQDLLEMKTRVSKLEDLMRVLTAQRNGVRNLPKMAQELEVTTRYGKTIVVKIPKGQALVPLRSSRSQTPTPSNSAADSALNSQFVDEDLTVDRGDVSTSSQDTAEIAARPADLKAETMEKPLPPVPSAAAFPASSSVARSSQVKDLSPPVDSSAWSTPQDAPSLDKPSSNTPSLNDPPLQILPKTPRAPDPSAASVPKFKGKSKAKKWTDPPLFQGEQTTAAEEQTKTLFSFHDTAETPSSVHTEAPEHKNNGSKNMSPIRDVTNHMMAQKPIEIKQEPSISNQKPSTSLQNAVSAGLSEREVDTTDFEGSIQAIAKNLVAARLAAKQEVSTNGLVNKKRFLGEESHDLYKQVDENHENQPPIVKPTQANPRTAPAPVLTADAIKSIMKSVAPPKSKYAASVTITANEGSGFPPTPVVINVASSPVPAPATTPAPVDKAPKSIGSGRIAKGSAIKKITESSSSEPPVATKPSDTTPLSQSPTPNVQDRYPYQKAPVASTASSTAASQVPRVLAPAAPVTSPPMFTPNMSASAPTFQPSGSLNQSRTAAASGSSFTASLMAKMTPEQRTRFMEQMSSTA